jgi:hypothetical protein
MNVSVGMNFITGMMLGFEYVHVDNIHHIVIDLLFVRFIVEFE